MQSRVLWFQLEGVSTQARSEGS